MWQELSFVERGFVERQNADVPSDKCHNVSISRQCTDYEMDSADAGDAVCAPMYDMWEGRGFELDGVWWFYEPPALL